MDWGGDWWLAAAFSNGIATNTADWKCTNQIEDNWNSIGFDASHWTPAVQRRTDSRFNCGDQYIWWTGQNLNQYIYCRYTGTL